MLMLSVDGELIPGYKRNKGKMRLSCAGKDAKHSGRYSCKCPANVKHLRAFFDVMTSTLPMTMVGF